ncbi:MAG: hypothetical protein HOW73_03200 [Polyangiaceae bacterium]|nr:hypothetical protein [Polyangiaceae bacterium]
MTTDAPPTAEAPLPGDIPPWARKTIVAAVVVTTGLGMIGTAFLPYLLVEHPLLLLGTSADVRNIVLVAPRYSLPVVMAIALPRRVLAMALTYGMGVLYGRAMLAWSVRKLPRIARVIAAFERLFKRFQRTLLVVFPSYATNALAGVTRTELRSFIACTTLGQAAYVVFMYYLGDALSDWTDRGVEWLRMHLWQSTAVCVGAVAIHQAVSLIRRRRAARLNAPQEESTQ